MFARGVEYQRIRGIPVVCTLHLQRVGAMSHFPLLSAAFLGPLRRRRWYARAAFVPFKLWGLHRRLGEHILVLLHCGPNYEGRCSGGPITFAVLPLTNFGRSKGVFPFCQVGVDLRFFLGFCHFRQSV